MTHTHTHAHAQPQIMTSYEHFTFSSTYPLLLSLTRCISPTTSGQALPLHVLRRLILFSLPFCYTALPLTLLNSAHLLLSHVSSTFHRTLLHYFLVMLVMSVTTHCLLISLLSSHPTLVLFIIVSWHLFQPFDAARLQFFPSVSLVQRSSHGSLFPSTLLTAVSSLLLLYSSQPPHCLPFALIFPHISLFLKPFLSRYCPFCLAPGPFPHSLNIIVLSYLF